ncbi:MAG: hypothetical protein ACOYU7_10140 [Bacillota bacterium]
MYKLVKVLAGVGVLAVVVLLVIAFLWWFSLINQWPHQVVLPR